MGVTLDVRRTSLRSVGLSVGRSASSWSGWSFGLLVGLRMYREFEICRYPNTFCPACAQETSENGL